MQGNHEYSPLLHSDSSSFKRGRVESMPLSDITGTTYSQTISIREELKQRRYCIGVTSTLVLSLGGLIAGYGLGYSSPVFFVIVLLPETRRKSLMEIENFFGGGKSFPFLRF